jgi:tRNA (guanine26-N2/guanine27-N2)-dimethyltransferase
MKLAKEGNVSVFVPEESLTKKSSVFFNKAMGYQRDVTISLLRNYFRGKKFSMLDPLAASGVRGIRVAREVKGLESVVFNDLNPNAIKLIRKNLKLNKIRKGIEVKIEKEDASVLMLGKERYDYVDIDPFGSPIRYLNTVASSLRNNSILGVTGTDSGALAGKFSNACMRRYGIRVVGVDFPKELGVRVLITSILRNLAPFDMTFHPIYSHGNHYFRVIGRVEWKIGSVDENLRKIRMVSYCPKCMEREIGVREKCSCGGKMELIGPIWTGKTSNDSEGIYHEFINSSFKNPKELQLCMEEIDVPFYYDLHMLCKKLRRNPPKLSEFLDKIKSKGYKTSRTRFCLNGFRTDCPFNEIKRVLKRF